jgi:uncharacterized protein with PIN domain
MSKIQEAGLCPKCKTKLEYEGGEPEDDSFFYGVQCTKCPWYGREYYDMNFSEQVTI